MDARQWSALMGRHIITHTCGHDETVTISGPSRDQERKAAWMASSDCYDCQRSARNAAAAEESVAAGWPTLSGSDKQIAWATTIRAEKIGALLIPSLSSDLLTQTEARWWIDHRQEPPEVLAWRAEGQPERPTRAEFICMALERLDLTHDHARGLAIIERFGDPRALIIPPVAKPLAALSPLVLVDRSEIAFLDEDQATDGAWGWMVVHGLWTAVGL